MGLFFTHGLGVLGPLSGGKFHIIKCASHEQGRRPEFPVRIPEMMRSTNAMSSVPGVSSRMLRGCSVASTPAAVRSSMRMRVTPTGEVGADSDFGDSRGCGRECEDASLFGGW